VVAIGHWFGSYTVLAFGGATFEFDRLELACEDLGSPNLSLLLQCRKVMLLWMPLRTTGDRSPYCRRVGGT